MLSPCLRLLFLTLLFLPGAVRACSCVMMASGNPPCQSFWSAPVVFSGRVTEIKDFTVDKGDMKGSMRRLVKLMVLAEHRGSVVGGTAEVTTGSGGGDCGYRFEQDQDYLVYAYRSPEGELSTGICTPTKQLSAAQEDLAFIESLSRAKPLASIFGMVSQYKPLGHGAERKPPELLANVVITAEGKGTTFKTQTDSNGKYKLADLLPGEYLVRIVPPEGLTGPKESRITLPEKGCSVMDFTVERQNSVSGRIVDSNGEPVGKLLIDMVSVDQINDSYAYDHHYVGTDANGRFDFRTIPPGIYFLGVRLTDGSTEEHRYPRTFYPGTRLAQEALRITVDESTVIKGLDFQLPQKLAERKIEGIVTFPDGKPAANAMISVSEGKEISGRGYKANVDGRFSITILEGLTYRVKAIVNLPSGGQRHAEPIDIAANGAVKGVKLVVTEPNGNCPKCLR